MSDFYIIYIEKSPGKINPLNTVFFFTTHFPKIIIEIKHITNSRCFFNIQIFSFNFRRSLSNPIQFSIHRLFNEPRI